MEKSGLKLKIIYFLVKIIPMITLLFKWSGIYGVKQYSGLAYIFYNKTSSIIGLFIIFGEIFLNLKPKYKMMWNLVGHALFWTPLFFSAVTETNNICNLTAMFYVSLFLVIVSLMLQLLISKNKGLEFNLIKHF